MKIKTAGNIYAFVLTFLGEEVIFGGGVLVISPNGELFRMPLLKTDNL